MPILNYNGKTKMGKYHNDKPITSGSEDSDLLNRLNSCVVEMEMEMEMESIQPSAYGLTFSFFNCI